MEAFFFWRFCYENPLPYSAIRRLADSLFSCPKKTRRQGVPD